MLSTERLAVSAVQDGVSVWLFGAGAFDSSPLYTDLQ